MKNCVTIVLALAVAACTTKENAALLITRVVPLTATARAAPASNAARVRFIALPARVCVPCWRTGAAEATSGDAVVGRNSVSNSGLLTGCLPRGPATAPARRPMPDIEPDANPARRVVRGGAAAGRPGCDRCD